MGDGRIKVAKDKAELVKALRAGDDTTGPFQSYADVLVFAASLGIQRQIRKPITEYSKEIDPIRQDIFSGKGYEQIINLISVVDSSEPKIVANNDRTEEQRIKIFEEYANSGLEILTRHLFGTINYYEAILLILHELIKVDNHDLEEFDLSSFL
jgi:dnd system-associated protein 4